MAEGPAGSRTMIARMGGALPRDEEARAYLQTRLTLLSRLMFWSFVVLLGFMVVLYARYKDIEPPGNKKIYLIATVGIVVLAIIWRGFLLRRQLSLQWLFTIDLFYAATTGTI